MQNFEKYPKLTQYIQEYASYNQFSNWSGFLEELNQITGALTKAIENQEQVEEEKSNLEDWGTIELFTYLTSMSVIHPDEEFEDWKHDRADMVRMVKEDIQNNQ